MKKKGVVSLPQYLSVSNLFPAFIVNNQGLILAANDFFAQVCGIDNVEGKPLQTVFNDDSFTPFLITADRLTEAMPVITISSITNGFDISWEIAPYTTGHFICTGCVNDYSKNLQGPVNENYFSAFFDNGPALMWATDSDGHLQMMNKRYKQHTGFTDAYRGKTIWEIFPKKMADQFKKNDDIVLKTNELLVIEEESVNSQGVKRSYLAYKFPLPTTQHGVMVAGCSIDITDIIEKTKQLDFQSHLLDSIEQAVYVLDANRKIIYWNRHAEKMFGWRKDEILHKDISILNPPATLFDTTSAIDKNKRDGEIELQRKDGTLVPVFITKSPILDADNNSTGFIGISTDISEHKIVHKKLVKQNNQFRQIARLQSHAVRRPLANVLGLIDLIQHYSDKKEFDEVLYMISLLKESSEDLDDIIRRIVLKAGVYFDPSLKTS